MWSPVLDVFVFSYGCTNFCRRVTVEVSVAVSGYHAECHTPAVDPEVDSDTWVCRQCVFAVATKVEFGTRPIL